MDSIIFFINQNAHYAHWVVFSLLMLAGLNFPISEDLVIIASALLASTTPSVSALKIFVALFLGAYISDWVAYWIGRIWGPSLWKFRLFSKFVRQDRLEQIREYYARYGMLTLLVGRFIPFGVRNCLFLSAGIGKMPFGKFLISDGIACFLSNLTLFSITYFCGKNISYLMKYVHIAIFVAFVVALIGIIWYKKNKTVSSLD